MHACLFSYIGSKIYIYINKYCQIIQIFEIFIIYIFFNLQWIPTKTITLKKNKKCILCLALYMC